MRLPPLNALRAFEAAARHEGFVGASDELHVTRGAISRQVKLLEEHLGRQLFLRNGKGVELTSAGRQLLPVLTDAFKRIGEEATRIVADASDLRVICSPATSIRWLLPRLQGFRQNHPEINIRLTSDFFGGFGFDAADYDLGFSCEHWPGRSPSILAQPLFEATNTPACAPALLARGPGIERPEDLARHTLLHESTGHGDWITWLKYFGVQGVDPAKGLDLTNLDMATKAAVLGNGIVMADLVLCRDEFESGALVQLFPDMVCPYEYGRIVLIGEREKWNDPKVRAFREWAAHEAGTEVVTLGQ